MEVERGPYTWLLIEKWKKDTKCWLLAEEAGKTAKLGRISLSPGVGCVKGSIQHPATVWSWAQFNGNYNHLFIFHPRPRSIQLVLVLESVGPCLLEALLYVLQCVCVCAPRLCSISLAISKQSSTLPTTSSCSSLLSYLLPLATVVNFATKNLLSSCVTQLLLSSISIFVEMIRDLLFFIYLIFTTYFV